MLKLLLNSIFVLCLIKFSLSENTMIFPNLPVVSLFYNILIMYKHFYQFHYSLKKENNP